MLEANKERLSGIVVIDPAQVEESLALMERWIANGPAIGIKYGGGKTGGLTCSHPNNDRIIRRAAQLHAVIYIHTWIKVGGTPRTPGGGNNVGESTPMDVAQLATRFPNVNLICGYTGGDWELGIRAIRPHKNVYLEFAGGPANSGAMDLALKEVGVERTVWGSHAPTRSYATELSKVLDGDLRPEQRMMVLGQNLRKLAAPILRTKGVRVAI